MNEKKRLLIGRLKEKLKEIIKKEMEEGTGTVNVAAPATPYAFAKSGKGNERAATASTDYELVKEGKKSEKKSSKASAPAAKKPAAPAAPAAPAKKQDDTKVTPELIKNISHRERENQFKGDKADVKLFRRLGALLRRKVGRELGEADIEKMMEDAQCDECWEEGAKPDFLDLDGDGNKTEPMKQAAKDAKTKNKK